MSPPRRTATVVPRRPAAGAPYRTLYLLHGFAQDHALWCRQTAIERCAEDRGIAVVMPEGHHSFWVDMAAGGACGTFVEQEVPAVTRSLFPPGLAARTGSRGGGSSPRRMESQ